MGVLSPTLSLFGKGDVSVKTTVGVSSFSLELGPAAAAADEVERCFLATVRPLTAARRRECGGIGPRIGVSVSAILEGGGGWCCERSREVQVGGWAEKSKPRRRERDSLFSREQRNQQKKGYLND